LIDIFGILSIAIINPLPLQKEPIDGLRSATSMHDVSTKQHPRPFRSDAMPANPPQNDA